MHAPSVEANSSRESRESVAIQLYLSAGSREATWRDTSVANRVISPRSSARGSTRSAAGRRDATFGLSERLDAHRLAGGHVATLLVEHDQAVAGRHRGQDARALRPGGAHLPGAVLPLDHAALELAPAFLLGHRLRRARLEGVAEEPAPAAELVEG